MDSAPTEGAEYRAWKRWSASEFARLNSGEAAYFRAELKRCGIPLEAPLAALEIGFGNGQFLAFARKQGWAVEGTELNHASIEVAQANGFHVHHVQTLDGFETGRFDLVVAFDVLEHIEQSHLLPFLQTVQRILKPGGSFVARFPNADSPFGLVNQHGDPTHVTAIGSEKARSLIAMLDAELRYVGPEAQPMRAPTLEHTVHRFVSRPFKALLDLSVRAIFYPRGNVSFSAVNLVMAFRTKGVQTNPSR